MLFAKKKESKENEQQTEKDRSQQIDVLNIETQPTDQKKLCMRYIILFNEYVTLIWIPNRYKM